MSYRVMDEQERALAEALAADLRDGDHPSDLPTGERVRVRSTDSTKTFGRFPPESAVVTTRGNGECEYEVTIVVRRIG